MPASSNGAGYFLKKLLDRSVSCVVKSSWHIIAGTLLMVFCDPISSRIASKLCCTPLSASDESIESRAVSVERLELTENCRERGESVPKRQYSD